MKVIIFLALLALSTLANAQTATATANGTTATARANGTTVVARVNTSTPTAKAHYSSKSSSSKTSVSISDSDDSYTLRAEFDSSKRAKLQKLLLEHLDKDFLSTKGSVMVWKKEQDDETAYIFALSEDKLKVSIDKELISRSSFEKFKTLGEKISDVLTEK